MYDKTCGNVPLPVRRGGKDFGDMITLYRKTNMSGTGKKDRIFTPCKDIVIHECFQINNSHVIIKYREENYSG